MPRLQTRPARALLGAAAIAVAGSALAFLWFRSDSTRRDLHADLVSSVGTHRIVEGRLTGGFAYGKPGGQERGESLSAAADPSVRIEAARLQQAVSQGRTAETLQAFAAGQLLTGSVDAALQALTEAVRLEPRRASAWSDLAAGHLASAAARSDRRGRALVEGLNAAMTAVRLDPSSGEALFNRALLTERVLPTMGVEGWEAFLGVDNASGWAAEARDRLAALKERERVRDSAALTFRNASAVATDAIQRAPQQARHWVEEQLLPAWAEAARTGNRAAADHALGQLGAAATSLAQVTGDRLLSDTVIAIRAANPAATAPLAAGHLAYAEGRRHYAADRLDAAGRAFARSERALSARSPFALWAEMQLAILRFDVRDIVRAEAMARRVHAAARRAGYAVLEGRSAWLIGLCQHQRNAIDDALVSYSEAIAAFAAAGERENELATTNAAAENLRLRGEQAQSWDYLTRALEGSDAISTPRRRYLVFLNAALFAAEQGFHEAALAFYGVAIDAVRRVESGPLAEGLLYRARHLHQLGRTEAAREDVAAARVALSGDLAGDPYFAAELAATEANLLARADPAGAAGALDRAIEFFLKAEPARVPRLLLMRGRVYASAGQQDRANADFDSGIERFEARRRTIGDAGLRISYADEARELFEERVAGCLRPVADSDCAFRYAERASARTLLDTRRLTALAGTPAAVAHVPPGAAVARFWVMRDSVLVWSLARGVTRFDSVPVSAERIAVLVETFRNGVVSGQPDAAAAAAGRELYEKLLRTLVSELPGGSTLAIVPDGVLNTLPFGALPAEGRSLVERASIVVAPSTTLLLHQPAARTQPVGTFVNALLVGNPTVDRAAFPTLPPLPDSEREVRQIASLYEQRTVLVGAAATRRRFVDAASEHDVVHFAGHAVANDLYPMFSFLALGGEARGGSGALFTKDIAAMTLPRTRLVVLAACETASGRVSKGGEGVLSLARPFLAAGVPMVVATLWPVEDRATAALMAGFHRRYAATGDAVRALRDAQLEMIGGSDADLRKPRAWAGFVVIGGLTGTGATIKERS